MAANRICSPSLKVFPSGGDWKVTSGLVAKSSTNGLSLRISIAPALIGRGAQHAGVIGAEVDLQVAVIHHEHHRPVVAHRQAILGDLGPFGRHGITQVAEHEHGIVQGEDADHAQRLDVLLAGGQLEHAPVADDGANSQLVAGRRGRDSVELAVGHADGAERVHPRIGTRRLRPIDGRESELGVGGVQLGEHPALRDENRAVGVLAQADLALASGGRHEHHPSRVSVGNCHREHANRRPLRLGIFAQWHTDRVEDDEILHTADEASKALGRILHGGNRRVVRQVQVAVEVEVKPVVMDLRRIVDRRLAGVRFCGLLFGLRRRARFVEHKVIPDRRARLLGIPDEDNRAVKRLLGVQLGIGFDLLGGLGAQRSDSGRQTTRTGEIAALSFSS